MSNITGITNQRMNDIWKVFNKPKNYGISQEAIGQIVGLSKGTVGKYLRRMKHLIYSFTRENLIQKWDEIQDDIVGENISKEEIINMFIERSKIDNTRENRKKMKSALSNHIGWSIIETINKGWYMDEFPTEYDFLISETEDINEIIKRTGVQYDEIINDMKDRNRNIQRILKRNEK